VLFIIIFGTVSFRITAIDDTAANQLHDTSGGPSCGTKGLKSTQIQSKRTLMGNRAFFSLHHAVHFGLSKQRIGANILSTDFATKAAVRCLSVCLSVCLSAKLDRRGVKQRPGVRLSVCLSARLDRRGVKQRPGVCLSVCLFVGET